MIYSEDSSVNARPASISVALSSSPRLASKKATLISRMARMGQPTLPLPGSVGGPSDSEETEVNIYLFIHFIIIIFGFRSLYLRSL